jgi:hypothetical protein
MMNPTIELGVGEVSLKKECNPELCGAVVHPTPIPASDTHRIRLSSILLFISAGQNHYESLCDIYRFVSFPVRYNHNFQLSGFRGSAVHSICIASV